MAAQLLRHNCSTPRVQRGPVKAVQQLGNIIVNHNLAAPERALLFEHLLKHALTAALGHETAVQRKYVGMQRGRRPMICHRQRNLLLAAHTHVLCPLVFFVEVSREIAPAIFVPEHGIDRLREVGRGLAQLRGGFFFADDSSDEGRIRERRATKTLSVVVSPVV